MSSRPTILVEDEGFVELFNLFLQPQFEVLRRKAISEYISDLYDDQVKVTNAELATVTSLSLTTDGGSSSNAATQ